MYRIALLVFFCGMGTHIVSADEVFITIERVDGNRITFSKAGAGGGRGRGMQGRGNGQEQAGRQAGMQNGNAPPGLGGGMGRAMGRGRRFGGMGRGRFGGQGLGASGSPGPASATQATSILIPNAAKITAAMRERRTFEFRVGIELAGGMRNPIFTRMKRPLSARLVTVGNRVTELNVITEGTDINQLNTSSTGQTIIAVKPKRPPRK